MDPHLLAFSGYPSLRDIVSSVALTFFAFLGFGIVSFTAKDLANPSYELPRAMYLALGIATVIYVAVALGVFGTLTVEEVIASGGTAIAKAAEPTLGTAGYWLMSVTALFATSGATNGGLYPASGLCEQLASVGQFPPVMGRRLGGRAPTGLLLTAVLAIVLAVGFDLNAIASIGSAIALVVFALVTDRPPAGPRPDRRPPLHPPARHRGDRHRPRDVRRHDARRRAAAPWWRSSSCSSSASGSTSDGNDPATPGWPSPEGRRRRRRLGTGARRRSGRRRRRRRGCPATR